MSDGQVEQLPFSDPRLGRHIRHDVRSRGFPVPRGIAPTTDVRHRRHGTKLDQGAIGACTGFAGAHTLNTLPLRAALRPRRTLTSSDALRLYSAATALDPWPGAYPPADTGSSGLAVCQAMQAEGLVSRYEWAFGFEHGLDGIAEYAFMQGTWWTEAMFTADTDGRVHPTGADAGGHEYLWLGVEIRSRLGRGQNRSWFLNSWGPWGFEGRGYFWMTWDDHAALLARDGDLIRPAR